MQKRILIPLISAALVGGAVAGVGLTAFAAESSGSAASAAAKPGIAHGLRAFLGGMGRGVSGTVTAISGSTITVKGEGGAIYTIDASGATVTKFSGSTSTSTPTSVGVAGIAVGDTVHIAGQIETATLSAKKIEIGTLPKPGVGFGRGAHPQKQGS